MFTINAECAAVLVLALLSINEGLRCYTCDSRSVIGYYDAEKDCNTDRSLRQCPDVKHKACMIEAFRHEAGEVYHIIKRCLINCPAFVNGSAEHTRCCAKEACNDVISIDVIDHRTASDLVADVREHPTLQQVPDSPPIPPPAPAPAPPVLSDNSVPHHIYVSDDAKAEKRDDSDVFEQRQLRPIPAVDPDLGTLPQPSDRPMSDRGRYPASVTPLTSHRERRPPPGAGGSQWWKGGLRPSSTAKLSPSSVVVTVLAAACPLLFALYMYTN